MRDVLVERSVVLETSEVEGEAAVSEALGDVFADQGFPVEAYGKGRFSYLMAASYST